MVAIDHVPVVVRGGLCALSGAARSRMQASRRRQLETLGIGADCNTADATTICMFSFLELVRYA